MKNSGFNNYYDDSLKMVAGSMYVKRHFPVEAKKAVLDMIKYKSNMTWISAIAVTFSCAGMSRMCLNGLWKILTGWMKRLSKERLERWKR